MAPIERGSRPNLIQKEREPLQDACGLLAVWSPRQDIAILPQMVQGLKQLQTRGYDGAGIWWRSLSGEIMTYKGQGIVDDVFTELVMKGLQNTQAQLWIGQVRYGTNGAFHQENVQPVERIHNGSGEPFVVAHNGQFSEKDRNGNPAVKSDTVRFTEALAASPYGTWDERIINTIADYSGAFSLIIGTPDGLYLARDPRGIRPLLYTVDPDTGLVTVASESIALEQMSARGNIHSVRPGEILKCSNSGIEILQEEVLQESVEDTQRAEQAACIFENVYIQAGPSRLHRPERIKHNDSWARTTSDTRIHAGRILAREAPLSRDEVDIVVGIPGTAIDGGIAYAKALGLPYRQAIRDKTPQNDQRTFMKSDILLILKDVLDHFNFEPDYFRGENVVLVDDSIVRGNVMKGLIQLLKEVYGALEVHVRILSPPIDKPCHLGINTRSDKELIAARFGGDIEKIKKFFNADSLVYISPEGLREAMTGNPQAPGFCMGCMAHNNPPINQYGDELVSITNTV